MIKVKTYNGVTGIRSLPLATLRIVYHAFKKFKVERSKKQLLDKNRGTVLPASRISETSEVILIMYES